MTTPQMKTMLSVKIPELQFRDFLGSLDDLLRLNGIDPQRYYEHAWSETDQSWIYRQPQAHLPRDPRV
jgi:hypothetical protein